MQNMYCVQSYRYDASTTHEDGVADAKRKKKKKGKKSQKENLEDLKREMEMVGQKSLILNWCVVNALVTSL